MHCPNCGYKNENESNYCLNCGTNLSQEVKRSNLKNSENNPFIYPSQIIKAGESIIKSVIVILGQLVLSIITYLYSTSQNADSEVVKFGLIISFILTLVFMALLYNAGQRLRHCTNESDLPGVYLDNK